VIVDALNQEFLLEKSAEIVDVFEEILMVGKHVLIGVPICQLSLSIVAVEYPRVEVVNIGNERLAVGAIFHCVFHLKQSLNQVIVVPVGKYFAHNCKIVQVQLVEGINGILVAYTGVLRVVLAECAVLDREGV